MFRSLSTLVLLLLVALPSVALAQNVGKLAGRVTDASTGETLIGANVFIESLQRGAATDADGNYTILGLPVGTYDVRVSYASYQTQTQSGVEISQGRTRTLDVALSNSELGVVTVEYERPLIQADAIGVPRVVTGADIQNLPVRGVQDVAAIQAGVVNNDGSNTLNIRGGRGEEVDYYVDGVRVVGSVAVPQQAIAEQEMLIGTIPPQYGDATAGVISISTRSGGSDFFGAVEAITSEGLDAFGYNLGSLTLGGPIVNNRLSFFASAQGIYQRDASPYSLEIFQLRDDVYSQLQSSPQVIRVDRTALDANGNPVTVANPFFQDDDFFYVSFPANFDPRANGGTISVDSLARALGVPSAALSGGPQPAYNLFSNDSFFETRSGKDDPSQQLAFSGNIEARPVTGVNLRFGGAYTYDRDRGFSWNRSFFNRDVYTTTRDQVGRGYVSLRQVLSNTAFYQLQAEYSDRFQNSFPDDFGDGIEDILLYGDIDAEQNATAQRYFTLSDGQYTQQYSDGAIGIGSVPALGLAFAAPGTPLTTFSKFRQNQFRVFGNAQTQVGVHELSFGGEYLTLTQRQWSIGGAFARRLAQFYDDGTVEAGNGTQGVGRYSELPFSAGFADPANVSFYGYDFLGLNEVDDDNVAQYQGVDTNGDRIPDQFNRNVAPYNPIYYGGYVRDRIEYRDLVIDLGLRVDVFDNNTRVLFDPFALQDIYRVSNLRAGEIPNVAAPASIPNNIDSDYAVYLNGQTIVGYRDLNGNFFNANGESVPGGISGANPFSGASPLQIGTGQLTDASFRDYEPAVTVMPRIGVTFPVTDRALFFASYNVTSQRPSENAFASLQNYVDISQNSGTLNNANLRPETTTQYELGFRQRLGQQAALTLSGFYRTQSGKITLRNFNGAFPSGYTTYTNQDFTTTKGVELGFDLRRTRNLALNANYTLSFAEGTGSDSRTANIIAWRSQTNVFPETLAPLDFDQRHNFNASVDYRFGTGEGPMIGGVRPFSGFGFNLLGVLKSGNPYTQLDRQALESPVGQSTNGGANGGVNATDTPFTSRLDLRVDRDFQLGGASLRGYVWVQNLLDQDNVFGVYRTTGLPDDDGFLSTDPDAVANLQTQLQRDAYRYLYNRYVSGPTSVDGFRTSGGQIYGLPRRIRLGVTLSF